MKYLIFALVIAAVLGIAFFIAWSAYMHQMGY